MLHKEHVAATPIRIDFVSDVSCPWCAIGAAVAVLSTGQYADDVRALERFYTDNGIHAVPAVILDQRHLIPIGQPVEVFEGALRQLAAAG